MKKLITLSILLASLTLADTSVTVVPVSRLRQLGLPIPSGVSDYIMWMSNDVVDGHRYNVTISYISRGISQSQTSLITANVNGALTIVNVPDAAEVSVTGLNVREVK